MKKQVLVTLADKNYVKQAKQLFSSAYWNGGWDGDFLLLSYNIAEKELEEFRKKGILVFKCKKLLDTLKINNTEYSRDKRWIEIVSNKFYLFTNYFKKWDNIIFLDSDIIVRASINRLKNLKGINAVKDTNFKIKNQMIDFNILNNKDKELYEEINKIYDIEKESFNSGVMIIDTEIINKDLFETLLKKLKKYGNICALGDQTILNFTFYDKWKKLDLVYNSTTYFNQGNQNSIILHVNSRIKAWDKESIFYNEWSSNFERFKEIDLQNPKKIKEWSILKIKLSSFFIQLKLLLNDSKNIERIIGRMGNIIRKISPNLYKFIKKRL
ncbi:MAG: glycosyltransferase [Candidatus Nanoarchaeia archaeon]|nr:glycosyltransferase [Candidatus Nanoarchaeia archaeon]